MRFHPRAAMCVAGVAAFLAPSAAPALCTGVPFKQELRSAEVIAAGTVTDAWVEELPHGNAVTHYRLSNVRYAKGAGPADGLIATECGGRTRGGEEVCEDAVHLDPGARYILSLRRGRSELWAPFLMLDGCSSRYAVTWDSTSGQEFVRAGGYITVRASADTLVLVGAGLRQAPKRTAKGDSIGRAASGGAAYDLRSKPESVQLGPFVFQYIRPDEDPGTRATEAEFLSWLRAAVIWSARPDSSASR